MVGEKLQMKNIIALVIQRIRRYFRVEYVPKVGERVAVLRLKPGNPDRSFLNDVLLVKAVSYPLVFAECHLVGLGPRTATLHLDIYELTPATPYKECDK